MTDIDRDKAAYVMASGSVPERQAGGRVVTYGELEDDSNRIAQLLAARGLAFGDHIAIFMPNNEWYLKIASAAHRSGFYYTAINYHFNAEEVAYILDDSDAKALFVDAALGDVLSDLVPVMPPIVETTLAVGGAVDGYEDLAAVIQGYPAEPLAEELEGSPMLYSSGTTGRPKGIKYPNPRRPYPSDTSIAATGRGELRLHPRHRVPVARAAVPLGAVELQHGGAAHRRDQHRDGAVRPGGVPRAASSVTA